MTILLFTGLMPWSPVSMAIAATSPQTRTVNVPYLGKEPPIPASSFTPAIFWFGKVEPTINYTDVRVYYYDSYIKFVVHVIDRRLWYNTNPTPSDFSNWDAATIYLKVDGNSGSLPTIKSFKFVAQFSYGETTRTNFQASYQGNGSNWAISNTSFTTESGYRWESGTEGGANNNQNNRGWTMDYIIPFGSLGVSSPPATGTSWGLAVVIHDRDDAAGTSIPNQVWPEQMQSNVPSTWGVLHFGVPGYNPGISIPSGTVTIRNGLNGMTVTDGEVGGHTTCSENLWPDIWNNFGNANYNGYDQINIQNQWDLSDWSCYSKFYITFPLGSVPTGQTIVSATLSMYLFGGSSGGSGVPPDSYIQAFIVDKDWDESTLTWNNAPLALENITGTWVHPISGVNWVLYNWDVSRAVAQAYASGQPLRLALYSADGEYHTGKYFISSDWNAYDAETRPTLRVSYGNLCGTQGVTCLYTYIPFVNR